MLQKNGTVNIIPIMVFTLLKYFVARMNDCGSSRGAGGGGAPAPDPSLTGNEPPQLGQLL
jgi:hypothetical protein